MTERSRGFSGESGDVLLCMDRLFLDGYGVDDFQNALALHALGFKASGLGDPGEQVTTLRGTSDERH